MSRATPRNAGFTLIEVMIVVVIIGALAAIGIPSYNNYIVRARISEAVSGLSDMRLKMEQYFQDNRTYAGACTGGITALPTNTKYFDFSCTTTCGGNTTSLTATAYVVRACGKDQMTGFEYTVNEANARTTTITNVDGWTANATCWVVKQGGGC